MKSFLRDKDFDLSSQEGSIIIAQQVEKFWRDEGSPQVRCRSVKIDRYNYGVISNLMNGLPPVAQTKGR